MILFRHSLKLPRDWCCAVFIFHNVLKRTLTFSPLNPGAHVLLKNFMRSNYCFTAVPHRAFSIYIIISQPSLLSCNEIRKHTLHPTDWMGTQGSFLLYEATMRRGEKGNVLFHPENRLAPRELCWSTQGNPNRRVSTVSDKSRWICTVEAVKVIFFFFFPLVIYYSQQAKFTRSSDMLRMGI